MQANYRICSTNRDSCLTTVLPSEGWASPAPPPWSLHLTLWRSRPPSRCKALYAKSRCCSSDRWLDEGGDRGRNKSLTLWRAFPSVGWLHLLTSHLCWALLVVNVAHGTEETVRLRWRWDAPTSGNVFILQIHHIEIMEILRRQLGVKCAVQD